MKMTRLPGYLLLLSLIFVHHVEVQKDSVNTFSGIKTRDSSSNYTLLYQVQQQRKSTAAVTEIYTPQLTKTVSTPIAGTFTDRIAGLVIRQQTGEPGNDDASLSLRGQAPYVIIDGVPQSFVSINPEQIDDVYTQLRNIRKRAGIAVGTDGNYGLKANMTKDEMRTAIRNERRLEMAYEDHRFWDVRRWKTAPQNQNLTILAMKITRLGTTGNNYTYEKVPVSANPNPIFLTQNYFFPIMQSEISRDPKIIQNPRY